MNESHVAGAGFGGAVATVLVALGSRIGLHLTDVDSTALALGLVAAGAAVFHWLGRAGSTVGVIPAIRRFLLGPKTEQAAQPAKPAS